MEIHPENLEIALQIAISKLERIERSWGYTSDSALLAGWKELLKAVEQRKVITWKPV